MLNMVYFLIGAAFLVILSYIDYNTYNKDDKGIPSFLTSLFLLICFLANITNLYSAILGLLLALFLSDLELWSGVADFKVFVAIGFLLPFYTVLVFALILSILSIIAKYLFRNNSYMPFLPVIGIAFAISSVFA